MSKIHPGDEITVNYAMNHSMANLATRQEKLLNWGFNCQCDRCIEEKSNDNDVEVYKKFENFKMEVKKLKNECKKEFQPDKVIKEIICYEEMYNLAKIKHVSRSFIIDHILDNGFDASVQGYLCAKKNLDLLENAKCEEYLK